MPTLDCTDVLMSGDISWEKLYVYRRSEVVGDDGYTTITSVLIDPAPYGSVQPKDSAIGGNEIERAPDGQYRGAALTIHTQFRLQAMSPGRQPDVVVWNGDHFLVTLINDWTQYGAGFIEAELASMEAIDLPPDSGSLETIVTYDGHAVTYTGDVVTYEGDDA